MGQVRLEMGAYVLSYLLSSCALCFKSCQGGTTLANPTNRIARYPCQ